MNVILNCAVGDGRVPALARRCPLVLLPFLGQTVLGHALAGLAADGVKGAVIVAPDRTEMVRAEVGGGEAWGMTVRVVAEAPPCGPGETIVTLDRLPQLPEQSLWHGYHDWHAAQIARMSNAAAFRVGMRPVGSGVFRSLRSETAPDARLTGPCWIGANVFIGRGAVIGPGSIIEEGSYVDEGAEITGSVIGPGTYVGAFTEVRDSFAWGGDLLHLGRGTLTTVSDRFLLGALEPRMAGWTDRLVAWLGGRRAGGGVRERAGDVGAFAGNLTAPAAERR